MKGDKLRHWLIVAAIVIPLAYLAVFLVKKAGEGNAALRNNPVENSQNIPVINPNAHAIDSALSRMGGAPGYDEWLELGTAYLNNGKPAEAIEALNKAVALRASPMAIYYAGLAYKNAEKWDSCLANMQKTLRLKPDFIQAKYYQDLAQHRLQGDLDWY